MKKFLTIFLLVITAQIFAQNNQPQTIVSKPCACGRWNPLVLRQATGSMKYECGSRIEWSCNRPFQFTSSYQCSPSDASCQAKTTWDVRNGNVIIKSGTGTNNISDGFNLPANGAYTLTLNATCNGIKCPPCTFTIIIKDCLTCDCGKWTPLIINRKSYDCGSKIPWIINQPVYFATSYLCSPENESCQAKTSWELKKDGVIIKTVNAANSINDSFTPTASGTYTLTLNASCNGKVCPPCIFTVEIAKVTASCDCGSWSGKPIKYQSTATPTSPAKQGTINCNDSFTLPMGAYTFTAPVYNCSSGDCITYDWTFRAPNNFQATQRGTNILPLDFTNGYYGGYGTYTIYIYAKCGGKNCGTCEFKVVVVNKTTTTKSMSIPNANTGNPAGKTITRNWIADDTTSTKVKPRNTVTSSPALSGPGNSIPVANH